MSETNKRAASDTSSPVPEKVKKDSYYLTRVLTLSSIPRTWSKSDVDDYIKENTKQNEEVYKGVQYIFMERWQNGFSGKCHVRFSSPYLCKQAKELLMKANPPQGGQKIWVAFENKETAIIWSKDNIPNMKATNAARNKVPHKFTKGPKYPQNYSQNVPHNQNWKHWQKNLDSYGCPPGQHEEEQKNTIFQNNMIVINQNKHSGDTYGLSESFLKSIGVTPPLTSKIFVDHMPKEYDDENMIRKLFSHAGNVTSVAIISRVGDILKLKVDFDHPVEAVQAITMFHKQELYDKCLIVRMDVTHNAYKRFLPSGLTSFGPGLGFDGLPIKNVRNTIELQKAVNMIMNEIGNLKSRIESCNEEYHEEDDYERQEKYQEPYEHQARNEHHGHDEYRHEYRVEENSSENQRHNNSQNQTSTPVDNNIQNTLATLANTLTNPVANNPLLALGALLNPQATQMLQLLTQQNTGSNMLAGLNTLQTQANQQQINPQPQASTGWNVGQPANVQNPPNVARGPNTAGGPNMAGGPQLQGGYQGDAQNTRRDECTLAFNYLPPSVTSEALLTKMREFGEVRSAQLTGLGRALVTFYSRREADACINLLDRTKVDGQTIEVRYT